MNAARVAGRLPGLREQDELIESLIRAIKVDLVKMTRHPRCRDVKSRFKPIPLEQKLSGVKKNPAATASVACTTRAVTTPSISGASYGSAGVTSTGLGNNTPPGRVASSSSAVITKSGVAENATTVVDVAAAVPAPASVTPHLLSSFCSRLGIPSLHS